MRRALLLCAMLLVGAAPQAEAAAGPHGVGLLLTSQSTGAERPFMAFDTTKLAVFDLDGDGTLEIVGQNDNGRVYVFRGSDGKLVSELSTTHPTPWGARDINDVAVGDVNGNGRIDLVVANSVGYVTVFELDESQPTVDRLAWTRLWEKKLDPRSINPNVVAARPGYDWSVPYPGMDGGAYLADVDRDGKLEIFVQTDNQPGFFALNHDGSLRWGWDWSDGNANPWVDDLDGDGSLEAIFVSDGGGVFVFDAATGAPEATFHAREAPGGCAAYPAAISVSPAVVDLDGDGAKEIVFGVRQANGTEANAKDPAWRAAQDTRIFAISPRGTMRWCFTADWMTPHVYMHPATVDVNGDGHLDLILVDWNTIGHKPGTWEVVGPGHVFALSHAGALLWKRDLRIGWTNKDVAVADVDGDGTQEILVPDERGGREGIVALTLAGEEREFLPASWSVTRGPQAADLDGDGKLDVLVAVHRAGSGCATTLDVGCREGALEILRLSGTTAAFPGVFLFNHEYERAYTGASPKEPKPPELTQTEQTGLVRGTVKDERGRPLAGADVALRNAAGAHETMTAKDGTFEIRAAPGNWTLSAHGLAHAETAVEIALAGGALVERDLVLKENLVGRLVPDFVHDIGGLEAGVVVVLAGAAVAGFEWVRRRKAT